MWNVRTRAILAIPSEFYEAAIVERWSNVAIPEAFAEVIVALETTVAIFEDRMVGWGMLDTRTKQFEAMFVDPAVQRNGIGSAIYSRLDRAARNQNLDQLELSSTLNAVTFYENVGFKSMERSIYRHPSGFELACVKMKRDLTDLLPSVGKLLQN